MISKPPPLKGLKIRIAIIIPIKGTGFSNQGSGFVMYPLIPYYLEVRCTYNLLRNCSYDLIISPIITVTLDLIGL